MMANGRSLRVSKGANNFGLFGKQTIQSKIQNLKSKIQTPLLTRRFLPFILLNIVFIVFPQFIKADTTIEKTQKIVTEIINNSYPELRDATIEVKTFTSDSDYFRSQFSMSRYVTFQKMHYIIFVNSAVFTKNAPENGIRSIVAHELAHALYFKEHNRFELMGLVKLSGKDYTAKFERQADLESIARGYAEGLKLYRIWLYQNIPSKKLEEKKRNYFSPTEIDLILEILKQNPAKINEWRKRVPLNENDLRR
jgi:hypothetical protein